MTSSGVMRSRTLRILQQRIAKFGNFHPATFAAYARAFVAWDGRIRPPDSSQVDYDGVLAEAYTTAQLRVVRGPRLDPRWMEQSSPAQEQKALGARPAHHKRRTRLDRI